MILLMQGAMQQQGLQVTAVTLSAVAAVVPAGAGQGAAGMSTTAIVGLVVAAFIATLLALGCYWACIHRQCCSRARKVAAASDAAQPEPKLAPSDAAKAQPVKPFFEAPQFQQTYKRQPSLVAAQAQQQQRVASSRPPLPRAPASSDAAIRAQHAALQRVRAELAHAAARGSAYSPASQPRRPV
jgi:FtsZ-interacting cell division protein ZipA